MCARLPPCLSLALIQVNPLAEDADGKLIAADAKLGFDDSAGYRQKDTFAMRDESQLDSRCVITRGAL
jgi:succinyl-CoA synthetase beta subunit